MALDRAGPMWIRSLLAVIALLALPLLAAAQADAPDARDPVLLVASPDLQDPNFAQTVVLVLFPAEGGPMGVILNRPTPFTLGKLFPTEPKLKTRNDPVGFGGPVRLEIIMFLFRTKRDHEGSLHVLDDLYLSNNADVLYQLLEQPRGAFTRYFVGYSGWARSQLQMEIDVGAWYVLPADRDTILNADPKRMWKELLLRATAVKT
jgi:putative transcriptional regulator